MTIDNMLQHWGCMQKGDPDSPCRGEVGYHAVPHGTAVPRCDKHWRERLDRYEDPDSLERWAHSDVAPDWFDPADAGERWDDDY